MNVSEIMTTEPIVIEATQRVRDALEILSRENIRHLPVLDEGELRGVLSDRDLRTFLVSDFYDFDAEEAESRLDSRVSEIMIGDVVSVEPETTVAEVVRMMIDQKFGALPVVDFSTGELLGIVSYIDILRAAEGYFAELAGR
ncbi:MAG: CBS domain-containing protein [Myxococcales bacterium]|nr:CBS domain-containing protein [Myxococcales bacterium]